MTLGEFFNVYGELCRVDVYELSGAPVSVDNIPSSVPLNFLTRSVVSIYPYNFYCCITIEED